MVIPSPLSHLPTVLPPFIPSSIPPSIPPFVQTLERCMGQWLTELIICTGRMEGSTVMQILKHTQRNMGPYSLTKLALKIYRFFLVPSLAPSLPPFLAGAL